MKKIIDATKGKDGNIESVLLEGNKTFTPVDKAIEMAERGEIENAHVVKPERQKPYLRSNPDDKMKNNLEEMAED